MLILYILPFTAILHSIYIRIIIVVSILICFLPFKTDVSFDKLSYNLGA